MDRGDWIRGPRFARSPEGWAPSPLRRLGTGLALVLAGATIAPGCRATVEDEPSTDPGTPHETSSEPEAPPADEGVDPNEAEDGDDDGILEAGVGTSGTDTSAEEAGPTRGPGDGADEEASGDGEPEGDEPDATGVDSDDEETPHEPDPDELQGYADGTFRWTPRGIDGVSIPIFVAVDDSDLADLLEGAENAPTAEEVRASIDRSWRAWTDAIEEVQDDVGWDFRWQSDGRTFPWNHSVVRLSFLPTAPPADRAVLAKGHGQRLAELIVKIGVGEPGGGFDERAFEARVLWAMGRALGLPPGDDPYLPDALRWSDGGPEVPEEDLERIRQRYVSDPDFVRSDA